MNELNPASPIRARLLEPFERFFQIEASSGIVLLIAAVAALFWANSPWSESYFALSHLPISFGFGEHVFSQSVHFWINEGLMSVFFLAVGLEIRREMHVGVLADIRIAILPLAAALGGVMVPALIYIGLNNDPALLRGWAIPTATDIAFAVGVLTLLGSRVPVALRVLLLAIAIIDDVVAVLIIAFFYSTGIELAGLAVAAAGMLGVVVFQKLGVRQALPYVLPGILVWAGLLNGGVHPALSGVILGLMTPVRPFASREGLLARAARALEAFRERMQRDEHDVHQLSGPVKELRFAQREMLPPVERVQLALHPWVAFGIMPLFALANAGVSFEGLALDPQIVRSLGAGIAIGLLVGKPVGITLVTALFVRLGWCSLPPGATMKGVLVIGLLGGIGFTMSIFVCELAFDEAALLATSKLAVLVGSAMSAIIGLLAGRSLLPNRA